MTNDELVLQKLDALQEEVKELRASQKTYQELFDDMNPLIKQGFQVMLREMSYLEDAFQLEDLYLLLKRGIRNVRNMAYMLDQLETMVELWRTMEPLMKSAVHNTIRYLGTLEARGVFRTYEAMLDVRAKVAQQYGPEDIAAMGDGFVWLVGLLKKLSNPETMALLDKLAEIPTSAKLNEAKPVGPMGMLRAMGTPEVKESMGVVLQLTKALGTLKDAHYSRGAVDGGRPGFNAATE
jgi:uncharacterized protein YjgD (DUF1641 family)